MFSITQIYYKIGQADNRIRQHTKTTRILPFQPIGKRTRFPILMKMENEQHTGSFKARGSLNKVLSAGNDNDNRLIVTASTGNHGLGVSRALQIAGREGLIFLPKNAKPAKVSNLRNAGAQLRFVEGTPLDAELTAKQYAMDHGAIWISPYNDPEVVAGQGTIGIELAEQVPNMQRLFVTVGGGGLASGIAAFIKTVKPEVQIIGCVPENSPEMQLSVEAGHIVHLDEALDTLSDGSAGGAEDDSITFPFCRDLIDSWQRIPEDDIADAMRCVYQEHNIVIEGSAGVALAACLGSNDETDGDVVIICGGNIDVAKHAEVIGNG